MSGSRPEQAALSRDTDMTKTAETRRVIETMVDGLNDHRIDDIGEFFAKDFRWMGNRGCGTKQGLAEFQANWQRRIAVSAVVSATGPLFILVMFFQRQIVSGLTAGAVKG